MVALKLAAVTMALSWQMSGGAEACGVLAVHDVLMQHGIESDVNRLLDELGHDVLDTGCSMTDLQEVLREHGVRCRAVVLQPAATTLLKGPGILFLPGTSESQLGHFYSVAVDSRDSSIWRLRDASGEMAINPRSVAGIDGAVMMLTLRGDGRIADSRVHYSFDSELFGLACLSLMSVWALRHSWVVFGCSPKAGSRQA